MVVDSASDTLRGVRLSDGREVAVDALAVQTKLSVNMSYARALDLTVAPTPVGHYVKVNTPSGRTDVRGVWAVGNVSDLMGQVATGAANGLLAGADINNDLVDEDAEAAVVQAQASKK